mmetsp:Transcript_2095/g.5648  ORF Transcript_2095/g.5648 Transcript_2095/m.5648 type:complete len:254 (-) Transcript_2095:233-994(-)
MAYERGSRRAVQSRQRAKPSFFPDDGAKVAAGGMQTPAEDGTPTAKAINGMLDLSCVPTPVRGRSGLGMPPSSKALFTGDDVLPSTQQALTYRERLRATGAQALRCVRDAGIATKAARDVRGPKTTGNMSPTHMPFGSMMGPAAVPHEAAGLPALPEQHLSYVPVCGTSPMAQAQGLPDWNMMSPVSGSPHYWPQTPMGCVSPMGAMMEVPQFQEEQHTNLMAIAMPQAMGFALDRQQIEAQLLAAVPAQYED